MLCHVWERILRSNLGRLGLGVKVKWGITSVNFGLTYHFQDLNHIHLNSGETLCHYYSIDNVHQNTNI